MHGELDRQDATSQLEDEFPLHQSEYLHAILQYSRDITALLNENGTIRYVSQALEKVLGYSAEEWLATSFWHSIHPDDLQEVQKNFAALLSEPGISIRMEYRLRHKQYTWVWVAATLTNHLHNPQIQSIIAHFYDITERRQLEIERNRLQRLVDANLMGITFTRSNGAVKGANDRFLQIVGYEREDMEAGKLNWSRMTPVEYAELDRNALQEIARLGAVSRPYEKEYYRKDERRVAVLVGGALIDADQGEIATFVIDISEQKRIEAERQRSNEQMEVVLKNIAEGIIVQDIQGKLIYVNDVAATMGGFTTAESMLTAQSLDIQDILLQIKVRDSQGSPLPAEQLPGRVALAEKKHVQEILQYVDAFTGQTRWSLVKAQPIYNEAGEVRLVVNVLIDITEQQMVEQRKNEFISMASHELKTPITALKGFTHVLQRRLDHAEHAQSLQYLVRMDGQLNKLTKLVNDLLDISRIQTGKLTYQEEQIALLALLQEIGDNIQGTTITHQIELIDIPDLQIKGDRDRLGQVLINLLTNAIKYSPQANRVMVRACREGDQARISIQDFGIGIAETYHQQIFERFYQVTDPEEKTYPGLGIGLYIAHEIIMQHQGRIWVESVKGEGSTFFFTLPLV